MRKERYALRINELAFDGFRNMTPGTLTPTAGVNILYGDNAQGKTNLLEACWLFTGGKSFRGAKDAELIRFGAEEAKLSLRFEAGGREQTADIRIAGRRQLTLNGIPQKSPTAMAGRFCAVVFCPAHLSLLSGTPEERRRFIDMAYCQLRPGYMRILSEFHRILTQRNTFLKAMRAGEYPEGAASDRDAGTLLDVWDTRFAESCTKVTLARAAYLRRVLPVAAALYNGLSGEKETLGLSLSSPVDHDTQKDPTALYAAYLTAIREARPTDLSAGFSTVGAHREDLQIDINGAPAKAFASQGQQRSAVLALKLSEASLLREVTGEQPVALLDDVMSELDVFRQDYILNHIHDWQVLITCCDPVAIERQTGGSVFHIQNGKII